jgi:hypothetical protein
MTSLIERLDAAYKKNPNPDAILAQINNQMAVWTQGKDITAETLARNYDQRCGIALNGLMVGDGPQWTFTWPLDALHESLANYWFILAEYFNPDDPLPN